MNKTKGCLIANFATVPLSFLALFVSLPTKASTGRMRVWRSVKAQGCATLRDGVYLLPDSADSAATLGEVVGGK
ncbi:hypothetical protein [Klebsiella pneumoniae]|uniref:hypothetical protein n=1 Tax=Klebsiella pneumoniae TaxID=573 RepID=UPI001C30B600|nr:hypothetical protein [Klebsiella pneumoniae]